MDSEILNLVENVESLVENQSMDQKVAPNPNSFSSSSKGNQSLILETDTKMEDISPKLIPKELRSTPEFGSNKNVEIKATDLVSKRRDPNNFGGWKSSIHFIWWQGSKDLLQNQNAQKRLNSWKKHFPNATIRSWDEKSLDRYIKESYGSSYYSIWKNDLTSPKEKVQWARYILLLSFGGIVPHVDLECLAPFQIPNDDAHIIFMKESNHEINLQMIASERAAGFWKTVLQESLRLILCRNIYYENLDFDDLMGKKLLSKIIHQLEKEKSSLLHRVVFLDKGFIQKSNLTEIRNFFLGPQDTLIPSPQIKDETKPIYDHCEHRWERKSAMETQSMAVGLMTMFLIGLVIIGLLIWEHITLGNKFKKIGDKPRVNTNSLGKDENFNVLQNKFIGMTSSNQNWIFNSESNSISEFESSISKSTIFKKDQSMTPIASIRSNNNTNNNPVSGSISHMEYKNAFQDS